MPAIRRRDTGAETMKTYSVEPSLACIGAVSDFFERELTARHAPPKVLAQVNVANMSLHRDAKGGSAIMIIETDEPVPRAVLDLLQRLQGILHVTYYEKED